MEGFAFLIENIITFMTGSRKLRCQSLMLFLMYTTLLQALSLRLH